MRPQKADAFGWEASIGIAQSRRVEACLIEERSDIEPACLQRLRDPLDPEGSTAVLIAIHSCHRSEPRYFETGFGATVQIYPKMHRISENQLDPESHLIGRKSQ